MSVHSLPAAGTRILGNPQQPTREVDPCDVISAGPQFSEPA